MFVKRRLQCVETTMMELLCMCLDNAGVSLKISQRVLSLSTRHSIPRTQVVVKVGDVFFSSSFIVSASQFALTMSMHVLTNTCVAIYT